MENPSLNGRTILRFAHAFESGAGTERYLEDLDNSLLERHAMTIVRLHLTRNPSNTQATEERIGRGILRRVPLQIIPEQRGSGSAETPSLGFRLKQYVRDRALYNPVLWQVVGRRWTRNRVLPRQPGQAIDAGRVAAEEIRARKIDLAMLHFFGGSDADEVIAVAKSAGIPVGILNHYSNDRFLYLAIRKHVMLADGAAGVNGLDVPAYIGRGFVNLSDGIDTEFFRRTNGTRPADAPADPIVLLTARVVREKGGLDLVRAAAIAAKSGTKCSLVLAGRSDDPAFEHQLRREAAAAGIADHLHLIGSRPLRELRDWYAAAAMLVLPTYHHEGLPRVILEAQAMQLPVIAYTSGGVADGIVHEKTGYLVKPGDIDRFAGYLSKLAQSASLRADMGAAGRKLAEQRFSLQALADRHERFYLGLLKHAS